MIKPTPGRIVHFTAHDPVMQPDTTQPLAAIITCVWNDRMVNLSIFDQNGGVHARASVPLLQDDDPVPVYFHAQWMPFQKGQAQSADTNQIDESAKNRALAIHLIGAVKGDIDDHLSAVDKLETYMTTGKIQPQETAK
jgi:hypothetical protein